MSRAAMTTSSLSARELAAMLRELPTSRVRPWVELTHKERDLVAAELERLADLEAANLRYRNEHPHWHDGLEACRGCGAPQEEKK